MLRLPIRIVLPAAIGGLALLSVSMSGRDAWEAYGHYAHSRAYLDVNRISALLLNAAGDLAQERGVTNGSLHAAAPITVQKRDQIAALRQTATRALSEAMEKLKGIPGMRERADLLTALQNSMAEYENVRRNADLALSQPANGRDAAVRDAFFQNVTTFIAVVQDLRMLLEALVLPAAPETLQLVQFRHQAFEISEFAGQERGLMGGLIASGAALDAERARFLAHGRGRIEAAWSAMKALRAQPNMPQEVLRAIDPVEAAYFRDFDATRRAVLEGAAEGSYPISADEWIGRATAGINTILALSRAVSTEVEAAVAAAASSRLIALSTSLALLLVSTGVAAAAAWLVLVRIVASLSAMTTAMGRLAAGDNTVDVPGTDRTDEVGAMAEAVLVFKRNAIERLRLEAEQAEQREARERRLRTQEQLIARFEASVATTLKTVASAATELDGTAKSMSSIAAEASRQASASAAAAEQTSANVQTVASAAEEMSASIREIAQQVARSNSIAGQAVRETERTDETVRGLSAAASQIGDVIKLIQDIAAKTNLLALNATIEAARAGEAGKGFAVVASEVKALANQTARATEEIGQQIAAMQEVSSEAVTAIQAIGRTITSINDAASAIAAAVEEQHATTDEISRNVQQAAAGTREVSTNIVQATQSAAETGAAAQQVMGAAAELSRQSEGLRADVERFLDGIRAA
ncbi:methyl-accepting chemotaxis protein [Indioceanicola profundi]|uniref:methyl-accepting chemotaxis protein n=1 Tax=Indioceanicola profundi TaxID=2220096 RepID=UPI000E6A970D|nr:methyl-accepting chemotaxis protein [Indioceanicola profundi]